jgi:hypothetical protein
MKVFARWWRGCGVRIRRNEAYFSEKTSETYWRTMVRRIHELGIGRYDRWYLQLAKVVWVRYPGDSAGLWMNTTSVQDTGGQTCGQTKCGGTQFWRVPVSWWWLSIETKEMDEIWPWRICKSGGQTANLTKDDLKQLWNSFMFSDWPSTIGEWWAR